MFLSTVWMNITNFSNFKLLHCFVALMLNVNYILSVFVVLLLIFNLLKLYIKYHATLFYKFYITEKKLYLWSIEQFIVQQSSELLIFTETEFQSNLFNNSTERNKTSRFSMKSLLNSVKFVLFRFWTLVKHITWNFLKHQLKLIWQ